MLEAAAECDQAELLAGCARTVVSHKNFVQVPAEIKTRRRHKLRHAQILRELAQRELSEGRLQRLVDIHAHQRFGSRRREIKQGGIHGPKNGKGQSRNKKEDRKSTRLNSSHT